jgi:hypothetical protein
MSERARPQRIPSKYLRPRSPVSLPALILGLMLGIAGSIYYAWYIDPAEPSDIAPSEMSLESQRRYIAAIAVSFAGDSDLNRAVSRLLALRLPGDPIQAVADAACALANSDYIASPAGLFDVRAMMYFYQLQGRTGCADQIVTIGALQPRSGRGSRQVSAAATPTLTPPPSKTPTLGTDATPSLPAPTAASLIIPTAASNRTFALATINTFCDPRASGVIEVFVYAANGASQLPGQPVRVRWSGGESRFFTGLKPERGAGFADFQMDAGVEYILDMPNRADPLPQPLSAAACTTEAGERALRSYRVAFRALS